MILPPNLTSDAGTSVTAGGSGSGNPGALDLGALGQEELAPGATTNVNLTVNGTAVNLSSQFWGATVTNEVHVLRGETNLVNATPARTLVWPGAMAGEDYDPFTNTHYDTYTGVATPALTNESQFVSMCREIHCEAIMQVPAEIDDPAFAAKIVEYTEKNLSFTPAYWMIGNEPELWEHWDIPWVDWPYEYGNTITPTEFGYLVQNYTKAIRAVDATTPILGLPASGCTCGYWTFSQWISGVLSVTGSSIQAVAFHEYPAGWLGTGDGSLKDFYGTIQGAASIPTRVAAARQAVLQACPKCNVSVFISELGSALSHSDYGQYSYAFSGALSIASQITQAMDENLTNIDLFCVELNTSNSWFSPSGGERPDYEAYTDLFDHLGTEAFPVSLPGYGQTLYAIDTIDPSDHGRRDLLVVNDNITNSVTFAPQFAESNGSSTVESWQWAGKVHFTAANDTNWVEPLTPYPVRQEFAGGLPANYTLPRQSMVLFEMYPAGASVVRIDESGAPNSTRWFTGVGGQFYTTTATNFSVLLPPGSYPIQPVGIPLPIGGKEFTPREQLGGMVASPLNVTGVTENVSISFVPQWQVTVNSSPSGGGVVEPAVSFANVSEPLNLTAVPQLGYAFDRWSGWGPGSYNGTGRIATLFPTGPIVEKALFLPGLPVYVEESGLPSGTPWSVVVRGFESQSHSSTLTLYEPVGSYGLTIDPIAGFRTSPSNTGFTVAGYGLIVIVQFIPLRPPLPMFPETFLVSGLPQGTVWSITIRNATVSTQSTVATFDLTNGSYAYRLGDVPGFHPEVPDKTFNVLGGPFTISIPFVITLYHAIWEASGTRGGLNWSVEVDGTPINATSAWVSTAMPNGSYSYAIAASAGFWVVPRSGTFDVQGSLITLPIQFGIVQFPVTFEANGLAPSTLWSVRFGNRTSGSTGGAAGFYSPNGTYTFDIGAPAGYYSVPSHGNVTVAGSVAPLPVSFHLTSTRPSAALVIALGTQALTVAFWIGVSVWGGFIVVSQIRRRSRGKH
jgi:hypothetical protein